VSGAYDPLLLVFLEDDVGPDAVTVTAVRQGIRSHSFVLNLYLCNAVVGGKGEEASCLLSLLLVFTHRCDKLSFSSLCEK